MLEVWKLAPLFSEYSRFWPLALTTIEPLSVPQPSGWFNVVERMLGAWPGFKTTGFPEKVEGQELSEFLTQTLKVPAARLLNVLLLSQVWPLSMENSSGA